MARKPRGRPRKCRCSCAAEVEKLRKELRQLTREPKDLAKCPLCDSPAEDDDGGGNDLVQCSGEESTDGCPLSAGSFTFEQWDTITGTKA